MKKKSFFLVALFLFACNMAIMVFPSCVSKTNDALNRIEAIKDNPQALMEMTAYNDERVSERALLELTNWDIYEVSIYRFLWSYTQDARKTVRQSSIGYLARNYREADDTRYAELIQTASNEDLAHFLKTWRDGNMRISPVMQKLLVDYYSNIKWDVRLYASWVNALNGRYDGENAVKDLLQEEYPFILRHSAEAAGLFITPEMQESLRTFLEKSTDDGASKAAQKSLEKIQNAL